MSAIDTLKKDIKKDVTEIVVLVGLFILGLIIMTLGFFWAGVAVMLYAFFRYLPNEAKILRDAEKKYSEEETAENKSGAKEAARQLFLSGSPSAAANKLKSAGFTDSQIAKILEDWRGETEREEEEEEEEGQKEAEKKRKKREEEDIRRFSAFTR